MSSQLTITIAAALWAIKSYNTQSSWLHYHIIIYLIQRIKWIGILFLLSLSLSGECMVWFHSTDNDICKSGKLIQWCFAIGLYRSIYILLYIYLARLYSVICYSYSDE